MLREVAGVATASLCPHCLARIPAERRTEGDEVVLVKQCPDHGEFRTVVWRGGLRSLRLVPAKGAVACRSPPHGSEAGAVPLTAASAPEHRQQSCTILLEVTRRCNLSCTFCFADSRPGHVRPLTGRPRGAVSAQRWTRAARITSFSSPAANLRSATT